MASQGLVPPEREGRGVILVNLEDASHTSTLGSSDARAGRDIRMGPFFLP